ncbi:three-helix bundle dimerization domain-containing protein [Amorphoplanes digitatis]
MPEQQVRQTAAHPTVPVPPGMEPGRLASPAMERSENDQIDEIISRLERRYTRDQISSADLNSRVRGFYRDFATARIRSFVSVFVERLVRRSIET